MSKCDHNTDKEFEMTDALRRARTGHALDPSTRILVQRLGAIGSQDLLEVFFYFFGGRKLVWKDSRGEIQKFDHILMSAIRILVDAVLWPFLYAKHSYSAWVNSSFVPANKIKKNPVVYLRTDHIFNASGGGAVAHINGVVNGFISQNLEVIMFSTDKIPGINDKVIFEEVLPAYKHGRNIPSMPSIEYTDQLIEAVVKQFPLARPSFVYQRYSLGNYSGVMLKRHFNVPFVCEFNGPLLWIERHWGGRKKIHEGLLQRIEDMNVKAADLVVVVSEPLAVLLEEKGIPRSRILVNPNAVDVDQFRPNINGDDVRKRYGLDNKRVVGFIGSFGAWHGAEVLAEAFGMLGKSGELDDDKDRLLMIGDGNTMEEVKAQLQKYNVMDKVVFTGTIPQDQAAMHLAACDVLVSPHIRNPDGSPFFGSPTKLFEYMAMGRGIVASDLDQIGEILENGKTAILVPPGDPCALAEGISRLINDEILRSELGRTARKKVVANYTWQCHVERILTALQS